MPRDAYRRARESTLVLRHLNDRLESERRRIAHALHDDTQQLLANVSIVLEQLKSEVPDPCVEQVDVVRRQLHEVSEHVRRLSHELRPTLLDDLGLVPALEFLASRVGADSGVFVTVDGRDGSGDRLPAAVETPLYRVVQEALANVARHSGARRAWVRIRRLRKILRLSVRDDGAGFDVASALQPGMTRGLGLAGIRERIDALGGTLEIRSVPGEGSRIDVAVPLEPRQGDVLDADPPADRRRSSPRP
jgi:signal transduction histidine kinase